MAYDARVSRAVTSGNVACNVERTCSKPRYCHEKSLPVWGETINGCPVHFFTSDVAWQIGHPPSLGISFASRGCMKRIRKGNMLNGCLCANPAFHSRTPADQPNMQRQQRENFEHRRLRKPNLDCRCMGTLARRCPHTVALGHLSPNLTSNAKVKPLELRGWPSSQRSWSQMRSPWRLRSAYNFLRE